MSHSQQPFGPAPWDSVIPERERALYAQIGFGKKGAQPGRAALLVIDVQYRSTGRESVVIEESVKQYPLSCGEYGWRAVPHIASLIGAFRSHGLPVIFPHVAPKRAYDGQRFADKAPAVMTVPPEDYEFVRECAPAEGDILLPKYHASSFFGTALVSHLVSQNVDTIVVTGATTSGCVRATVVDGSSYGFQVIVAQEAVYDRSPTSHAANLFDMDSKYADVMPTAQVVDLLATGRSERP